MSIGYTLYVASGADPSAVPAALGVQGKMSRQKSWVSDGPVSITAWRLAGRRPGVAEKNGVAAELGVDFELYLPELEEAKKAMVRDVAAVLASLKGDAVFIDMADRVVLRRKKGRWAVNRTAPLWTPELLALVPEPYDCF
ncbi:MAG: hypothetical protein KGL04_06760 [Elusimicrobia bacterium]|nr:hypothetical protein [Elusimicrobiota bacterium]MDE2313857.1 hypothetical protein [Elusimicrobiota bacterium]